MKKLRILLVDDEPVPIRVLRLALEKAGYEVETASTGHMGLQSILASQPDVLITDIEMPGMSGKDLCLALQADLPDRKFPIFVATSLTDLEHRNWSQAIPNLVFLEKPVSARKLLASLARHFGERATQ